MSQVVIRNPGQGKVDDESFYADSLLHSYGTTIKLDGRELPSVRAVSLKAEVDDLVRVYVDVLASDIDIEIGADVTITPLVLEPGILEIERSDDGKTQRIRFIREGP